MLCKTTEGKHEREVNSRYLLYNYFVVRYNIIRTPPIILLLLMWRVCDVIIVVYFERTVRMKGTNNTDNHTRNGDLENLGQQ